MSLANKLHVLQWNIPLPAILSGIGLTLGLSLTPGSLSSALGNLSSSLGTLSSTLRIIHRMNRLLTLLNCQVMSWKYQDLVYWYSIFITLIIEVSIFLRTELLETLKLEDTTE